MEIKDVEHLAELSKLTFTEDELKDFMKDFESIVALADTIKNVDIDGEIKVHAINFQELREDEVKASSSAQELVMNAPEADMGCFVVPRIME